MIQKSLLCFIVFILMGCKSQKVATANKTKPIKISNTTDLIKTYHRYETSFNTLSAQVDIDYDMKQNHGSNTLSIRIQKDSLIWVSAPFGIIKLQMTPSNLSFYNKLSHRYYQGNYDFLSQLLGAEVDFYFLQNILIGNAAISFDKNHLASYQVEKNNLLVKVKKDNLIGHLTLDRYDGKIRQQRYIQSTQKSIFDAIYNYQWLSDRPYPLQIALNAGRGKDNGHINLSYKNLKINQSTRFPYHIPKGYNKISTP